MPYDLFAPSLRDVSGMVVIADDYEYVLSRENADRDSELSILYVAITRAKKNVYIPESLSYLFK